MVYSRGLYQLARQLISKLFGGKTSGTFRRPPPSFLPQTSLFIDLIEAARTL
jgi:hypothetical protein